MVMVVSLVVAMEIEMVFNGGVVRVGMMLILLVVVVHTYTYIHTYFINVADA